MKVWVLHCTRPLFPYVVGVYVSREDAERRRDAFLAMDRYYGVPHRSYDVEEYFVVRYPAL